MKPKCRRFANLIYGTIRTLLWSAVSLLCLMADLRAVEPNVQNVTFQLTPDDRIEVTYDLAGNADDTLSVALWVSLDGGKEFSFQPKAVAGDVGNKIFPGTGRKIVWDVMADLPKFEESALTLKVTASWQEPTVPVEPAPGWDARSVSKYNIPALWGDHWAVTTVVPNKVMTRVTAGWKEPIATIGHAKPPTTQGPGGALYLHPVSRSQPAVIEGRFRMNRDGVILGIQAAGNRGADWLLVVSANGQEVGRFGVDGRNWHSFSFPLRQHKGELVTIQIKVHASGWSFEYAFIKKVWFHDPQTGLNYPLE